ncbi:hypothetical protein GCM10010329_70430 [Streptomyces spiroverticillatus]|uniref:Uncharacterized protein n=1 Tax=Streptomyces finlayi TaxID=67296 RepID=A0A918X0Z4_9ACTN|nr:hypothetical protein GCM10010329_70430 [Streptomyces spiroverticillatus]GHD01560.1 hypothetical protein GCM10010334_47370 [Streptomyces finlayi]
MGPRGQGPRPRHVLIAQHAQGALEVPHGQREFGRLEPHLVTRLPVPPPLHRRTPRPYEKLPRFPHGPAPRPHTGVDVRDDDALAPVVVRRPHLVRLDVLSFPRAGDFGPYCSAAPPRVPVSRAAADQ